jgi:hypothetical protein
MGIHWKWSHLEALKAHLLSFNEPHGECPYTQLGKG